MINVHRLPPLEELSAWLSYCPDTGIIRWKQDRRYNAKAGAEAGATCTTTFYRRIRFGNGRKLQAHRVAWALYYGEDPYPFDIDHIDGNRLNNTINNLRLVTRQQNVLNRTVLNRNNTSGHTGVYSTGLKWKAGLRLEGKIVWLGLFDSKEDAVAAWEKAAKARAANLGLPDVQLKHRKPR